MERRISRGRSLRRRRAFGRSVVEQGSSPVVRPCVDAHELLERERLPDTLAEPGGHQIDLVVQTGVAVGISPRRFDATATLIPLLARELDVQPGR